MFLGNGGETPSMVEKKADPWIKRKKEVTSQVWKMQGLCRYDT